MVKMEAIVRGENYEEIKDALNALGVHGITVSQVMGCGVQKGHSEYVRGSEVEVNMVPKIKFEIVFTSQEWIEKTVQVIQEIACTGNHGDGKIFVYEIMDAIRIRTGERGPQAIY